MMYYTLACLTNLSSLKIIFLLQRHHVTVIIILCYRDKIKLFVPFINTAFNSRWHTFIKTMKEMIRIVRGCENNVI